MDGSCTPQEYWEQVGDTTTAKAARPRTRPSGGGPDVSRVTSVISRPADVRAAMADPDIGETIGETELQSSGAERLKQTVAARGSDAAG